MIKNKFLIVFVILTFIACKEDKKIKEDKLKGYSVHAKFKFNFPDTVIINKKYEGKIDYKGILDTITTSLDDEKKYRYIEYRFFKTDSIDSSYNNLKKFVKDTLLAEEHSSIPLFNISFDKLGVNYLDGIIVDEIMMDTIWLINGKKVSKVRIITKEIRATHKVIVIDKE